MAPTYEFVEVGKKTECEHAAKDRCPAWMHFWRFREIVKSEGYSTLTGTELRVLMALLSYANHKDGVAFPSMATIAKDVGIKPNSMSRLRRTMRSLEKKEYVTTTRKGGIMPGDPNVYWIHPPGCREYPTEIPKIRRRGHSPRQVRKHRRRMERPRK